MVFIPWKIAWRNVLVYKNRSLVIGIIIFFGTLFMTIGNAIVRGARIGLEDNLANKRTGQITLVAGDEDSKNIFFTESISPLKTFPDYPTIKNILSSQDFVQGFVPMSRGYAMLITDEKIALLSDEIIEWAIFLLGVDFNNYQQVFENNMIAIEGSLLTKGEKGILLSEDTRKRIFDLYSIWVFPKGQSINYDNLPEEIKSLQNKITFKDELVLLGLSGMSLETDIRVPVKGIFRYKKMKEVGFESYIDIESFRECFGYFTSSNKIDTLSKEKMALFHSSGEDGLFQEDGVVVKIDTFSGRYDLAGLHNKIERDKSQIKTENGTFHFVSIKLAPTVSIKDGIRKLHIVLNKSNINVNILPWTQSVGSLSQMAALSQGVLLALVLFIFFVAAIIITNTLIMATLERTSEISMMRAIGAEKKIISFMIITEIAMLAAIVTCLGVISGVFIVLILKFLHIPTDSHYMWSLLFGGDFINPIIDVKGIGLGCLEIFIIIFLASLYPIWIAGKISPLESISRE